MLHTPIVVRTAISAYVGGSRPNQNNYVFVILVTHPKSYIETTGRRDFGGKLSKWRWDGCYREKFRNFVAWPEPDPKTESFRVFRVPFDYPAHSLQEGFTPNQWCYGKPRL